MSQILIFYHHPCSDGKAAAWVAHRHFIDVSENVHFFGVDPSNVDATLFNPLRNFLNNHPYSSVKVYCLDISLGFDSYQKLVDEPEVEWFIVIDHHKTGYESMVSHFQDKLPDNYLFDLNESGCSLAWKYFNPNWILMPKTIQYIKDRDLWTFQLPDSKPITEGIYSMLPIGNVENFSVWDLWMANDEINIGQALTVGKVLLKKVENAMPEKARDGALIDLNGVNMFVVNTTDVISDFGNYICSEKNKDDTWLCDMAIMWRYSHAKKLYYLSFRSNPDRQIDVSQFAKSLNPSGGGHRCAAGCTLTELPEWMK